MADRRVVRVWRGTAAIESADAYQRHVADVVFPRLARLDGYLGGRVLRHDEQRHAEFVVMTEWASLAAIHAFAGDDVGRAVVDAEARALLTHAAARVEHFNVVFSDAGPGGA